MGGKRSVKKGPYIVESLLKKVAEAKKMGVKAKPIKTWSRRAVILPDFVGVTFTVHNGKSFIPVLVNERMIGNKLGAFSPTRKEVVHAADRKAKRG